MMVFDWWERRVNDGDRLRFEQGGRCCWLAGGGV